MAGKINYYNNIGGKFKSSLVNPTTIKFNSLQSILPGQSTIVKVTFLGNVLNLKEVDKFSNNSSSNQSQVLGILLIFLSFVTLYLVFILFDFINKAQSNNNNGGCTIGEGFDRYGSCRDGFGGGGSSGGDGGGCGGGG